MPQFMSLDFNGYGSARYKIELKTETSCCWPKDLT
jgi:hypothetical protein